MTFVEAAVEVLKAARKPLSVEEITSRAVARALLSKPGKDPLRSMKGRLTTEAKKGDDSVVEQVEPGVWAARKAQAAKKPPAAKKAATKKPAAKKATAAKAEKPAKKAATKKPAAKKPAAKKATAAKAEKPAKSKAKAETKKKSKSPATEAEAARATEAEEIAEAPPPVKLTAEEEQLLEVYSDEDSATVAIGQLNEYRDEQTADEDREMVPEMLPERQGGRRGRQRRQRRDRSGGSTRDRQGSRRSEREKSPPPAPAAQPKSPVAAKALRHSSRLARAAAEALAGLGDSAPIRQLAGILRKRKMLSGSPEGAVAALRAALVFDRRWHEQKGHAAPVVALGRDRFEQDPVALAPEVQSASAALDTLEQAAESALAARLRALDSDSLERIVELYLEQVGYEDIRWIKRAGKSSYATASGALGEVLIGARVGDEDVDRRGVGELRVGVEAKQRTFGHLLSPAALSDEAAREWHKSNKQIALTCGDDFVRALMSAGIGIHWRTARVPTLDRELFDALS